VEEKGVRVELEGDILHLTAEHGDRKYAKEVLLPAAVDPASLSWSNRHGVLEIKMRKKAP
ncbi:MAG: Hsp20/alpha crystallin family protein, partial [Candidatus Methylomirabilales bacterium]